MYCPRCGQRLAAIGLSCPECTPSLVYPPPVLSGQEYAVLRYSGMRVRVKCDFPSSILNWVADDFVILSYPDHLVIVRDLSWNNTVRASASLLVSAASASLGGGLLVGAPLSLLDAAINRIKHGRWELDQQATLAKYSDCQLLWSEKSNVTFTCFDFRKMAWLISRPSAVFLDGQFHSALGAVSLSISFFDPSQYRSPGLSDEEAGALGLQCFTVASGLSDRAFESMIDSRYKGWEFLLNKKLLEYTKQFVKD